MRRRSRPSEVRFAPAARGRPTDRRRRFPRAGRDAPRVPVARIPLERRPRRLRPAARGRRRRGRGESFTSIAEAAERLRAADGDFDVFFPTTESSGVRRRRAPATPHARPPAEPREPVAVLPRRGRSVLRREAALQRAYTVYATGIGWRRDLVHDVDAPIGWTTLTTRTGTSAIGRGRSTTTTGRDRARAARAGRERRLGRRRRGGRRRPDRDGGGGRRRGVGRGRIPRAPDGGVRVPAVLVG